VGGGRGGDLEGFAEDGVEGLEEVARGADHAGDEAAHDQFHALHGILGRGCARKEEVRVPAGAHWSARRGSGERSKERSLELFTYPPCVAAISMTVRGWQHWIGKLTFITLAPFSRFFPI
jgi:hypothetical protein